MKTKPQDVNLDLDDVLEISSKNSQVKDFTHQSTDFQIPVDVYENSANFIVIMLIFGNPAENIKIDVSSDSLRVEYQVLFENSDFGDSLAKEIEWGKFSRSIIFPSEVDVDKSFAEISKNGVLKITLPKFVRTERKTLHIKSI